MRLFKKKPPKEGLEKARQMNLITELELLKLKSERAEADLKEHIKKSERHAKKKK